MNKDKFREICEKYEVVGANLWYIKDGVVTTDKYGYFDKEKNIKAIDDGVYRIASISKTILALGTMKLVEMGLLNLDEDISTYLGFKVRNVNFPEDIITTRMLMTQTSSITDGFDDEDLTNEDRVDGYNGVNGRKLGVLLKDLLIPNDSIYYSDLTFSKYRPGEKFIYSNFGCGIMACIIEKISNQNFDDFMQEHIFSKVGVDASYYCYKLKNKDKIVTLYQGERILTGVDFLRRAYDVAPIGENYLGPAGGLFININDLSKLMMSFWQPGLILKPETIDMMCTVNWRSDFDDPEYKAKALQMIVIEKEFKIPLMGHFGSAYGLRSMMLFNRELKTGLCFMASGGNYREYQNGFLKLHHEIISNIWE